MLDSAVTPIYALDSGARVLFANWAQAELLGTTPDALLGRPLAELVALMGTALPSPEAYSSRVSALLEDKECASQTLVEYRTDRRLYFKEISQPIRRPDGSWVGRLFLYVNATREKEIDQAKNEFISIASHELRTPMTSIKGSLDLLLGGFAGEVNEESRELLVIAQNGCERLIRLINDVLDISKIEAKRMQLRLAPISLFDCVQRST
ncbi:MAG: PAS domain-containing protein, partial [Anaerolineae bacterium]|nr:PAS domain-containing protein [Anaerolineae bacterium]